ncbi:MAG TPA: hypothetical protein VFX60_19930 [Micromonospora sp.]|nr:hypothetical protein [Micromonospora sp.]
MNLHRRGWRVAAAAVLVLLAAGCSIGDIRRPVPTQPSPASTEPSPAEPTFRPPLPPDELRQMTVPVSIDYRQQGVEFVDAEHGYVLFVCGPVRAEVDPDCPAVLLATSDGGRSWRKLRHPKPGGDRHWLHAKGNHVVLSSGDEWYVSADRGRTFARHSASTGLPEMVGERFGICCDPPFKAVERDGADYRELPNQPPVRGLTDVGYRVEKGRTSEGKTTESVTLWAGGVFEGLPQVAVSFDAGKTWRQSEVPAEADPSLSQVRFELAPDHAVWLFGYTENGMSIPRLWRFQGSDFVSVTAAGHPPQIYDVVAIVGGMLAVSGPHGGGVVTPGHYNDLGWPLGHQVNVLDDGTLLSVNRDDDSIWLGQGWGAERKWIKLVLFKT